MPVAGDDDLGDFYSSEVKFNARAGTEFHLAVDGFEGAQGTYQLSWAFEATSQTVPVLRVAPAPQTVRAGDRRCSP